MTRQRINLSLPIPIADALRTFTEEHQTYYLDVIVRAHAVHRNVVMSAHRPRSDSLPQLRKRKPNGRVQVALGVPPDTLQSWDADASELELDRSSYISLLLSAALKS